MKEKMVAQIAYSYLVFGKVLEREGDKLTVKLDMNLVLPVKLPLTIKMSHILGNSDSVELVATEAEVLESQPYPIVRFTVAEK